MPKIESGFVLPHYYNSEKRGKYLYDGVPCPTQEAYEFLGQKGIDHFHHILQSIMQYRQAIFGKDGALDYGFPDRICGLTHYPSRRRFFAWDSLRPVLNIKGSIRQKADFALEGKDFTMQDLQFPGTIKEPNYYFIDASDGSTSRSGMRYLKKRALEAQELFPYPDFK